MIVLKNNAQSLLGASIESADTQIRLSLGDGKLFPDIPVSGEDWFRAALSDNAGNTEYIRVISREGDVLTVSRGEEGSPAKAWNAGARIQVRMTAKTWADMAHDHWSRLTAPDGSILLPERISDSTLRLVGDWTAEAHPRRALRVPGSDTPLYITGCSFANGVTTVMVTGILPAAMPALDLGISQRMMPEGHALSDAVDSAAQNVGASSKAVKTAYDKAVAAVAAVAAAVTLNNTVTSTSTTEAATANAVKMAYDRAVAAAVTLNNTVTSSSTTEAATANAVKTAYDRAVAAASAASSAQTVAWAAAPRPQGAAGVGQVWTGGWCGCNGLQWVDTVLPYGGTWFCVIQGMCSNGTVGRMRLEFLPGGTNLISYLPPHAASSSVFWCWRIA